MDYKEKFKDPNWQKKRLEILKRDNFCCRSCLEDTKTLNVHHIYYDNKKEPWEYDNDDLITLCDECHKEWHRIFNGHGSDLACIVVKTFMEWENKMIKKALAKK